jgi:hypothetical protein
MHCRFGSARAAPRLLLISGWQVRSPSVIALLIKYNYNNYG